MKCTETLLVCPALALLMQPCATVEPSKMTAAGGGIVGTSHGGLHLAASISPGGAVLASVDLPSGRAAAVRREPRGASSLATLSSSAEHPNWWQHPSQPGPLGPPAGWPGNHPLPPPQAWPPAGPVPVAAAPPFAVAAPPPQGPPAEVDAVGPTSMDEAVREVSKFDLIVAQAERRAGLPDSTHTTMAPVPADTESEKEGNALVWAAVSISTILGAGAIAYSWHLHSKNAQLEAQLKASLTEQQVQQKTEVNDAQEGYS